MGRGRKIDLESPLGKHVKKAVEKAKASTL